MRTCKFSTLVRDGAHLENLRVKQCLVSISFLTLSYFVYFIAVKAVISKAMIIFVSFKVKYSIINTKQNF
jgi:hypothetical protein